MNPVVSGILSRAAAAHPGYMEWKAKEKQAQEEARRAEEHKEGSDGEPTQPSAQDENSGEQA